MPHEFRTIPLHDGYYWYLSAPGDEGDLEDDKPQIVCISKEWKNEIMIMGCDLTYKLYDAHGLFIGPIRPPEFNALTEQDEFQLCAVDSNGQRYKITGSRDDGTFILTTD